MLAIMKLKNILQQWLSLWIAFVSCLLSYEGKAEH